MFYFIGYHNPLKTEMRCQCVPVHTALWMNNLPILLLYVASGDHGQYSQGRNLHKGKCAKINYLRPSPKIKNVAELLLKSVVVYGIIGL